MKKLTEQQQIKEWMFKDNISEDSEDVLNEIFCETMNYKKENPHVSLRQAYCHAYMGYMDKMIQKQFDF